MQTKQQALILVVEDDPIVRMLAVDALTDAGYAVLEAENAAAAIALLKRRATDVLVLCTDVHMPGEMNGLALAEAARAHWPWIGLLVVSGRAEPLPTELPEASRFLSKPYDLPSLVDQVQALAMSG